MADIGKAEVSRPYVRVVHAWSLQKDIVKVNKRSKDT